MSLADVDNLLVFSIKENGMFRKRVLLYSFNDKLCPFFASTALTAQE